jgi:hypothetical protein
MWLTAGLVDLHIGHMVMAVDVCVCVGKGQGWAGKELMKRQTTLWQMTEAGGNSSLVGLGGIQASFVIFRDEAEIHLIATLERRCHPFVAASKSFPLQYVRSIAEREVDWVVMSGHSRDLWLPAAWM